MGRESTHLHAGNDLPHLTKGASHRLGARDHVFFPALGVGVEFWRNLCCLFYLVQFMIFHGFGLLFAFFVFPVLFWLCFVSSAFLFAFCFAEGEFQK